jgi:hypothetical protein
MNSSWLCRLLLSYWPSPLLLSVTVV